MASFRPHLPALLLLTGIFFLSFLARIVQAPLMPAIERDLQIGHGAAGSLFLLISTGYCAGNLCSGFVAAHLTHRGTIVLSAMAVGGALLGISLIHGLWEIRAGFFLLGMAAGLYLPSGIATLTAMVSRRDWGKAIAVHEMAPNLGFISAPLLAELLLGISSWRGVVASLGISSVVAGVIFARLGEGGAFAGEVPSSASIRGLLKERSLWIMVALFGLGIGASLGVYTMLPLYLVMERGVEQGWANTLVAFSRMSGPAMAFLAGWFTDRMGQRRALGAVFLATGGMTILLGSAPGKWVFIPVFLQPMLAVCFFPAGFAALARIGPPTARNLAVSLAVPTGFLIGGGVIPAVIGLMGDLGLFGPGIALVGGVFLLGGLLARRLRLSEEEEAFASRRQPRRAGHR